MRGLEVKRNGKVEHSDTTHDDQIFSYLVALYVWYEGKNLKENFGIIKSSIKTEDDIDEVLDMGIDEYTTDITQEIEYINEPDENKGKDDIRTQMADMKKAGDLLFGDYISKQRKQETQMLKEMLNDPVVREAYARKYNINPDDVEISDGTTIGNEQGLPPSLFIDFNNQEEEMSSTSVYNSLDHGDMYYQNHKEDNGLQ